MLPQLPGLTADQLVGLLRTALARQPTKSALDHICEAQLDGWTPWQLPAEQLLSVLQQAVLLAVKYPDHAGMMFYGLFRRWELPASSIAADAVAGLIRTALEAGSQHNCWCWLACIPAFQDISAQQLSGLLQAALMALEKGHDALYMLTDAPAFGQLSSAALTSIFTGSFAGVAEAAQAGSMRDNVYALCSEIFRQGRSMPATSNGDAVFQWFLPALTAALQAGMHAEARVLLTSMWHGRAGGVRQVFNAGQLMALMQVALKFEDEALRCLQQRCRSCRKSSWTGLALSGCCSCCRALARCLGGLRRFHLWPARAGTASVHRRSLTTCCPCCCRGLGQRSASSACEQPA